jgi:hypothetical protein
VVYKKLLYLIIVLSIGKFTYAQGGFKSRFYLPNSLNNTARCLFELSPGSYFAGGIVYDTLNGYYTNRLAIMGLNANGHLQWVKKYGNHKFEYLSNDFIRRCYFKQGNFIYYTGCVRDSNNKQIGVLIKFKANGDTAWQKIYRDANEDVVPQMVCSSIDGGFLITGFFQNWVNHTQPCLLIKTDANGNELWRKRLHKTNADVSDGKAILQDSATKKIFITGYQYIGAGNTFDNVLVMDSLGNNPVFNNYLGGGGIIMDMIQLKNKRIIVVGLKYDGQTMGGSNLMQAYIAKINVNTPSVPMWMTGIDKPTSDNIFSCLRELKNGEILIGGNIDTMRIINNVPNVYIRLTKVDTNGVVKFNRYYDYKVNEATKTNYLEMESLELTADESWIASIRIVNNPTPNPFFFVKYSNTGCDSTELYCSTLNLVGVDKLEIKNEGLKIYPNPSSDYLILELPDKPKELDICLKNVLGKELKRTRIKDKTELDLRDLSKGIYFVELWQAGKLISTNKIIKE